MLNTIDLFAGCGGLTEGFKQTGLFEMLAAVEWDKDAHATLQHRLMHAFQYADADERSILYDIQRVDELINGSTSDDYPIHSGLKKLVGKEKVNIVIGGPPCQAYSVAGRIRDDKGMHEDYRNFLFESYMKVVDNFQPDACIFENVPGMLSAAPGGVSIVDRIRKSFLDSGYVISDNLRGEAMFDVSYFGVPQKRKRVIIAAFRIKSFDKPNDKVRDFYHHLQGQKSDVKVTVSAALLDLPKIVPSRSALEKKRQSHILKNSLDANKISDHDPRYHNSRDIDIFRTLAKDIETGECKYTSSESLKSLYTEKTGKVSAVHKYHVLRLDQPSNTIPAHLYKDGLRHIHPDSSQARSITVREAARLQSFPDDYKFLGTNGSKYKMIGNAVPPLFAKKIAHALDSTIKDK
jgi:DNA (cytosine-5)-methyltransferase 1